MIANQKEVEEFCAGLVSDLKFAQRKCLMFQKYKLFMCHAWSVYWCLSDQIRHYFIVNIVFQTNFVAISTINTIN